MSVWAYCVLETVLNISQWWYYSLLAGETGLFYIRGTEARKHQLTDSLIYNTMVSIVEADVFSSYFCL